MLSLTIRLMKQIYSTVFMSSGKFRKICEMNARAGRFLILGYHRVKKPSASEYIEPGMFITPVTFKKQIETISRYFEIVSLKSIIEKTVHCKHPMCVLTFDDGWKDFYTHVLPVLKSRRYPATVFLPTEYIGNNRKFWTDAFAHLMIKSRFDTGFLVEYVKEEALRKKLTVKFNRKNLHELINLIKLYAVKNDDDEIINRIMEKSGLPEKKESDFINWEQVMEMRDSDIISFGSHTSEHIILTSVSKERVKAELYGSREDLLKKKVVTSDFIPFCYPNGFTNKEISEQVKSAGYSCAVTVRRMWNDKSSDIYRLNRIGMHQDACFSSTMTILRLGTSPVDTEDCRKD